jgi:hypothetical protein
MTLWLIKAYNLDIEGSLVHAGCSSAVVCQKIGHPCGHPVLVARLIERRFTGQTVRLIE